MSHALTKIYIHLVFATKRRLPLITTAMKDKLYEHITDKILKDFGIQTIAINGWADHIHILFLLPSTISLQNVVKDIKGESSNWMNNYELIDNKFGWQTGYSAFSISENHVEKVKQYLNKQEEHHSAVTYQEELEKIITANGFEKNR